MANEPNDIRNEPDPPRPSPAARRPVATDLPFTDAEEETRSGAVIVSTTWPESSAGPLPHPNILGMYEAVKPGIADRIVQMAEREQEHRHSLETLAAQNAEKLGIWGLLFALVVALAGLLAAVLLGAFGQGGAAAVVGGLDLAAIVVVFVVGHRAAAEPSDAPSIHLEPAPPSDRR